MTADQILSGEKRWDVSCGDCLEVLRSLPDASIDAMVTDPPSGISFMGAKWDHDKGGRDKWIAWLEERMREALRVLKPGAHALVWALPRTSHWTATALENAGFEIRDRLSHIFGSGFPKSLDVSKAIDRAAGREREVIGESRRHPSKATYPKIPGASSDDPFPSSPLTAPASDDAKRWDGWGTALKPAVEDWILVRKPLRQSVAKNVLTHGTGALNIDGCRVAHASPDDLAAHQQMVSAIKSRGGVMDNSWANHSDLSGASDVNAAGRWPSHLLLSHADGCARIGSKKVKAAPAWNDNRSPSLFTGETTSPVHHSDADGFETVDEYRCSDGCPIKLLDEQSGENASRYFTNFEGAAWASGDRSQSDRTDAISRARDTSAEDTADGCASNTAPSGSSITDPSLGDCRSIIATKTSETIGSKTSNCSTLPLISDCIADASCAAQSGGNPAANAEHSSQSIESIGTSPPKAGHSTDDAGAAFATRLEDVTPFVYQSKASRDDRDKGCEYLPRMSGGEATGRRDGTAGLQSPRAGAGRMGGRRNLHPCVKSTDLMRWLVRLISPPNGIVLDPFAGSGSTGVACSAEGMRFIGVELSEQYAAIARARIVGDAPLFNRGNV